MTRDHKAFLGSFAITALLAASALNWDRGVHQAHSQPTGTNAAIGQPQNISTLNLSTLITTGGTYQQLLPSILTSPVSFRRSLTIKNNQISGTDVCFLLFGSNIVVQVTAGVTTVSTNLTVNGVTMSAAAASYTLNPGEPYPRYFPYIPGDLFFVTCSTTGDSVYADIQ
jgi:hypothetical protein